VGVSSADQEPADSGQGKVTTPVPSSSSASDQKSKINNHQSETSPASIITPLPEIYQQAAPMLRCTSGQVFHVKIDETAGLHGAYFEWDGTDAGSVLEAFRHMPEACMGSIGMKLVSREKPIPYTIGGTTLIFDHTIFREPGQGGGFLAADPLVHAFRAVWVAGADVANARQGMDGNGFDRLRTIRLKSAVSRYRPDHARVIQGAVRGIRNPDFAWQAFEENMLRDLTFEK
jgi:hypothetical protein